MTDTQPYFQRIWESLDGSAKNRLAADIGTTYQVLHHVARGRRKFSPQRCLKVREVLNGKGFRCTLKDLRPDIWGVE